MEGITNETVNKEQQAQSFENLKENPLECSGNILFLNSSDPDLHFYNTNIQNLNAPHILPEEQNFLRNDNDENVSAFITLTLIWFRGIILPGYFRFPDFCSIPY